MHSRPHFVKDRYKRNQCRSSSKLRKAVALKVFLRFRWWGPGILEKFHWSHGLLQKSLQRSQFFMDVLLDFLHDHRVDIASSKTWNDFARPDQEPGKRPPTDCKISCFKKPAGGSFGFGITAHGETTTMTILLQRIGNDLGYILEPLCISKLVPPYFCTTKDISPSLYLNVQRNLLYLKYSLYLFIKSGKQNLLNRTGWAKIFSPST